MASPASILLACALAITLVHIVKSLEYPSDHLPSAFPQQQSTSRPLSKAGLSRMLRSHLRAFEGNAVSKAKRSVGASSSAATTKIQLIMHKRLLQSTGDSLAGLHHPVSAQAGQRALASVGQPAGTENHNVTTSNDQPVGTQNHNVTTSCGQPAGTAKHNATTSYDYPHGTSFERFPASFTYLAICAVVKDQNQDLAEWMQYHQWLGVEKFYIYDHNSSSLAINDILPWVRSGAAEYSLFAGHHNKTKTPRHFQNFGQGYVYSDCLKRSRGRHEWLAFIDIDEFLVIYDNSFYRNISGFLRQYESHAGLGVHWKMFGSSGHQQRPQGVSTLEAFTNCSPVPMSHIKTIAHVPLTLGIGRNPHSFEFKDKRHAVNELEGECNWEKCAPKSAERIALHHYVLKSAEQYREKMARGGGSGAMRSGEFFKQIDAFANKECTEAVRFGKECCSRGVRGGESSGSSGVPSSGLVLDNV